MPNEHFSRIIHPQHHVVVKEKSIQQDIPFDFVVKMDSDTRICPRRLEEAFTRANDLGASYVGRISNCGPYPHCPKSWTYMSGGFHAISRVASNEMLIKQAGQAMVVYDHEDMNTGHWMQQVAQSLKSRNFTFKLNDSMTPWNFGDDASRAFLCKTGSN